MLLSARGYCCESLAAFDLWGISGRQSAKEDEASWWGPLANLPLCDTHAVDVVNCLPEPLYLSLPSPPPVLPSFLPCSTLSLGAKKCGCPLEADTALLNSKMYVRNTPSLTCGVTGPSTATNTYFQGQINQILIPYGHVDCKGSIEYSQRVNVTAPASEPYPQGVPWMKDGQMIIRVLADKWVPMDDHEQGAEHP